MTGSPVQRITMDKSYGFGVSWADVLAWSGGALYLGNCDYSDSDEQTGGFDIDALGEYAARVGIDVADWQRRPRSVETDRGAVVERMEGAEGIIVVFPDGQGEKAAVIGDWQTLTLLLLADRRQGVGAWGRVWALLEQAGATGSVSSGCQPPGVGSMSGVAARAAIDGGFGYEEHIGVACSGR